MRKSVHTGEYGLLRAKLVGLRVGAGLSQRALGKRLGVPHTWVAKVESGERRIDLIEFGWFCAGCGVDASEIAAEVLRKIRADGYIRTRQTGMSVPLIGKKSPHPTLSRSTGRGETERPASRAAKRKGGGR